MYLLDGNELFKYLHLCTRQAVQDDNAVKKFIKVAIRLRGYKKFEQLVELAVKEMLAAGEKPEEPYPHHLWELGLVDRAERRLDYEPDVKPSNNVWVTRLDEVEERRYDDFIEYHDKNCPAESCSGGWYSYRITPTSIGSTIVIECNVCHKTMDITNYDSW